MECDVVGFVPLPNVKGYAFGKGIADRSVTNFPKDVQPAHLRLADRSVTNFPKNADKPSQTSHGCTVCRLPPPHPQSSTNERRRRSTL